MRLSFLLIILALVMSDFPAGPASCHAETNYDEAKVPAYQLPDPLVGKDGRPISTAKQWADSQRAYVLQQVEQHVFGHLLPRDVCLQAGEPEVRIVDGMKRKRVPLKLSRGDRSVTLHMLMYLPVTDQAVPTFVALNFKGNHTTTPDVDIPVTENWVGNDASRGYVNNRASEKARGTRVSRWSFRRVTERGYGLATIYYGDIDPDFDDGFKNGVHALFPELEPDQHSGGSISAWSWGLSRAMDYLQTDKDVDAKRVIVMGHSRLGKTSLWAGATDPRFAMVVSNNSGCGGAALSRRRFGETVQRINTSFPHWFCRKYRDYNGREDQCPVDQHWLVSLIAPRPVLICSAQEDRWADPHGEFLTGLAASGVYRLLGTDGMSAKEWPAVNTLVDSRIGYHIRPGKHDVTLQDWNVYMDFADRHLGDR